jgi:hypothetical protein
MLLRTTLLAAAAALTFTATASAGQIVYSTEPADGDAQIRVMNDDGSNDRLLVHEDDIPGAESVYKPYVSPDGATVVFQARTPGPGSGGVFCGFRCSGIYAYSGGTVTRISQNPIDCPDGDLCLGLDVDPRITGGGQHVFYQLIYGEPNSWGNPSTSTTNYLRSMTPGDGNEVEVPQTSCGEGTSVTPNPAVDGQFATSAYCVGTGGSYSLKVLDMNGNEETLGFDDADFSNPVFRGDGQLLAGAEDGNDPGLWLYPRDGSNPHRIVAMTWDDDKRPFDTNPTFIGNDRLAFIDGQTIRTVPTSCDSCSLGSTGSLGDRAAVDAIAWTSRDIPSPVAPDQAGNGGGGQGPAPRPVPSPGPAPGPAQPAAQAFVLRAPAKAKLAKALRSGIKVPFTATKTGRLSMRATVPGALAKRLRLARRAGKPVVVARGATNVTRAGEAVVTLRFTAAAKKRLKRSRSVALKLAGTFAGSAISGRIRLAR